MPFIFLARQFVALLNLKALWLDVRIPGRCLDYKGRSTLATNSLPKGGLRSGACLAAVWALNGYWHGSRPNVTCRAALSTALGRQHPALRCSIAFIIIDGTTVSIWSGRLPVIGVVIPI